MCISVLDVHVRAGVMCMSGLDMRVRAELGGTCIARICMLSNFVALFPEQPRPVLPYPVLAAAAHSPSSRRGWS